MAQVLRSLEVRATAARAGWLSERGARTASRSSTGRAERAMGAVTTEVAKEKGKGRVLRLNIYLIVIFSKIKNIAFFNKRKRKYVKYHTLGHITG